MSISTALNEYRSEQIKSRFDSYDDRKAVYQANLSQLLRSQVDSSYTPTYQAGGYIVPEIAIKQKDTGWHLWPVNLDQAQGNIGISITVTRAGLSTVSFGATNLSVGVALSTFLDNTISAIGSVTNFTFTKNNNVALIIGVSDSSTITGITAHVST